MTETFSQELRDLPSTLANIGKNRDGKHLKKVFKLDHSNLAHLELSIKNADKDYLFRILKHSLESIRLVLNELEKQK